MAEIGISNTQLWQRTHWRTIAAAYGSAPFWPHYAPELKVLYTQHFEHLAAFIEAGTDMVVQLLGIPFQRVVETPALLEMSAAVDWYNISGGPELLQYTQVFADRLPFAPNLSILDLLFCEGPHACAYLLPREG